VTRRIRGSGQHRDIYVAGMPDRATFPLERLPTYKSCLRHFQRNDLSRRLQSATCPRGKPPQRRRGGGARWDGLISALGLALLAIPIPSLGT